MAGRAGSGPGRRRRLLMPMSFRNFLATTRPELARPDRVHPAVLQERSTAATLEAPAFDVDAYDLAWQDRHEDPGTHPTTDKIRLGLLTNCSRTR